MTREMVGRGTGRTFCVFVYRVSGMENVKVRDYVGLEGLCET